MAGFEVQIDVQVADADASGVREAIQAQFHLLRDDLQRTQIVDEDSSSEDSEDDESGQPQVKVSKQESPHKSPAAAAGIDKACQSGASALMSKSSLPAKSVPKSKGQNKSSLKGTKNQKPGAKKPVGPEEIKFLFQSCSSCTEIHQSSHSHDPSLLKNSNPEVKVKLSKKWQNFKNPKSKGHLRIWLLLLQNAKAEMLLKRSKTFEQILKSQTLVTNQQMEILNKASDLGKRYSRNMALIMRLGFCPLELQDRSEVFTVGLNRVYRMIYNWDVKMDELVIKSKDKKAVLEQIFKLFSEEFGKEVGDMSDDEFANLCVQMGDIPELLSKELDFGELFQEIELMDVDAEWQVFRSNIQKEIQILEKEMKEICLEFGVTKPPAPFPKIKSTQ